MAEHPMQPPRELLKRWEDDCICEREKVDVLLCTAYAAGADAQLERDAQWVQGYAECGDSLRAAMRPKSSLKEQALAQVDALYKRCDLQALSLLRRALEALPDDI